MTGALREKVKAAVTEAHFRRSTAGIFSGELAEAAILAVLGYVEQRGWSIGHAADCGAHDGKPRGCGLDALAGMGEKK